MTADARQQAERVVDAVLHEDRRDGATGAFAVRRRAVDAFAAIIEVVDDGHLGAREREGCLACNALREALSALGVEVE